MLKAIYCVLVNVSNNDNKNFEVTLLMRSTHPTESEIENVLIEYSAPEEYSVNYARVEKRFFLR